MSQAEKTGDWIYRWGAKIFDGINDCPDDLAADAVQQTQKAIEEMLNTADAAQAGGGWEEHGIDVVKKIKAFLDEKYGPAFHVFIGKDFGAHVTHVSRNFIYFYFSDKTFFDKAVMIFKA